MNRHKVLIVMAMEQEASPVVEHLGISQPLVPLERGLPPLVTHTRLGSLDVSLVVNGRDPTYRVASFGTDAATLSTYLGIKESFPDLVVSAGVAGGFRSRGASIGTVYLSRDTVRYFDRRVSITEPNYRDYALGYYPSVDASEMARSLNLEQGIVVTGGAFENSQTDEEQIRLLDGAAVEMEAAGVARMSMLMDRPFLAVKSIVNIEADPSFAHQFEEHFSTAVTCLAVALGRILCYLSDDSTFFESETHDHPRRTQP